MPQEAATLSLNDLYENSNLGWHSMANKGIFWGWLALNFESRLANLELLYYV